MTEGDRAPDFTMPASGGRTVSLKDQKSKPFVLYFSPDAMPPIEKFAKKYNLTFPLASDPDHKVAEAFGVWVEKMNYGKTYMGIERSTFLIDAQGKIAKSWHKVKVDGHAAEVMAAAAALT